ncbi:MAG: FadR family transcriptional regulator [Caulobacteraceae bacterium]|nr:FadR family transcriptional regulator [Caulobacteraceae bacterium]
MPAFEPSPAGPGGAKRAQRIADQIERDILANSRPAGQPLGTEAELMARYHAGRSVVREALVLVERDGLAEMRRGKTGGLVVTIPSEAVIGGALRDYIDLVLDGWDELLRIRRELEDLALQLAITHFDAQDLADFEALRRRYEASPDGGPKRVLSREMLHRIGVASRNPFLSLLVTALANLSIERLARDHAPSLLARSDETAQLRYEQLRAVLAASPGRALAAGARIFELIDHMAKAPADPSELDAARRTAIADLMDAPPDRQKLAEKLCSQLKERIVTGGLREGAHLGSEPELMAAWGVSRGAVREAVRILERNSVARMVRGKGGGLRVLRPVPSDVVRSVCVYLRLVGVQPQHVQELGEVAARLAAETAAREVDQLGAGRLQSELEDLAALQADEPGARPADRYSVMAALSGSRTIGLIFGVLANLSGEEIVGARHDANGAGGRMGAPSDLLEAILAGDADMARRRMTQLQPTGPGGGPSLS